MSDLLQHQPETQMPAHPLPGASQYNKVQVRAALALLRLGWTPHWVGAALGLRDGEVRVWWEILREEAA